MRSRTEAFEPYVSQPVIDWTRETAAARHRRLPGTLLFADISGFTALTERLARFGTTGSEEMGDLLNSTFEQLLVPAYDFGAALIKWGGDAVLLLFEEAGHEARACRAAWEMQRVLAQAGRLKTSVGTVTLRMSIGVHSGDVDLFLVGSLHRELVVTGPAASRTAAMEQAAEAGQVLLSPETAALLDPGCCAAAAGPGVPLQAPPMAQPQPRRRAAVEVLPEAIAQALPVAVRQHIMGGVADSEHRVVAAGFVEFRGVDELLRAADADSTAQALAEVVDLVALAAERHQVTFLGTDIGIDGGKAIMVAGAPRSFGRAEERMLCVLREVLDSPVALRLRAGATSGRVFAGDFGPPYRRTYSVVGDSVNLAARLMSAAEPGQLVVTPRLLERSHTRFEVTPLPPLRLKGKSGLIPAAVVGAPRTAEALGAIPRTPLMGRARELARLQQALAGTWRGAGAAIDLAGAPGVGKTRLLEELRTLAASESFHAVRCDGFDAAAPYAVWQRLLSGVLPRTARELKALAHKRCPEVEPWLPLVGALLGVDIPATPELLRLDERFRRAWVARSVTALLTAVLDASAVLLFEDIHLMDDASSELLRATQAAASARPWLVITTRRPGAGPTTAAEAEQLVLEPLDPPASAALLESATAEDPLPPHELDRLLELAGGNPLFLLELLAARRRLGDVEALPISLEGTLAQAIDQLEVVPRSALRMAAVLGTRFQRAQLEDLLRAVAAPRLTAVWQAIEPFFTVEGDALEFRSSLLRESAYQALPVRQRRQLHGLVAEVIEQGPVDHSAYAALSFHCYSAQVFDKAASYSLRAGEIAAGHYANVEAAALFGRALDASKLAGWDHGQRAELAELLGKSWAALGELARAERAFVEARRLSEHDALRRGRINLLIATMRIRGGRLPQALALISRALGELQPDVAEEQDIAARLCALYAFVRQQQGRPHQAIRWARAAIDRAEPIAARLALAQAYQHLDRASVALGRFEHEAEAHQALTIFEELGERTWQAAVLNHLGVRAYYHGSWADALRCYEQARTVLDQIGDQWNAAITCLNIVEVYTDQGRLGDAESLLGKAERVIRAANTPSTLAMATALRARLASAGGRFEEAAQLFAAARDGFAGGGEHGSMADAEARSLESLISQGQSSEALQRTEQMLASVRAEGPVSLGPLLLRVRGWALAQSGDLPGASTAFTQSLQQARALNARADVALALDALSRLAEHRAEASALGLADERDQIFDLLGIVTVPHVPLLTRQRPQVRVPRQVPRIVEPA